MTVEPGSNPCSSNLDQIDYTYNAAGQLTEVQSGTGGAGPLVRQTTDYRPLGVLFSGNASIQPPSAGSSSYFQDNRTWAVFQRDGLRIVLQQNLAEEGRLPSYRIFSAYRY